MTRRLTELLGYTSTLLAWTVTLSLSFGQQVTAQEETLRCLVGWGSDVVRVIPPHWINDGYCDCPLDGADETNTDACSGIDAWPGSRIAVASTAAAASDGEGSDDAVDPQVTYVSSCIWMDFYCLSMLYCCYCYYILVRGDEIRRISIPLHPVLCSFSQFAFLCYYTYIFSYDKITVLPPFSAPNNRICKFPFPAFTTAFAIAATAPTNRLI
jgi:hypothetical protein